VTDEQFYKAAWLERLRHASIEVQKIVREALGNSYYLPHSGKGKGPAHQVGLLKEVWDALGIAPETTSRYCGVSLFRGKIRITVRNFFDPECLEKQKFVTFDLSLMEVVRDLVDAKRERREGQGEGEAQAGDDRDPRLPSSSE
jgi:hypothetical protein